MHVFLAAIPASMMAGEGGIGSGGISGILAARRTVPSGEGVDQTRHFSQLCQDELQDEALLVLGVDLVIAE